MVSLQQRPDVFAQAKAAYTIFDLWPVLNLPGEPRASCRSPFRDERNASFSIFDQGRAWKDHGTGEGGDLVEFVRVATGWSHAEIREWFMERLGIDHRDPPRRVNTLPAEARAIQFPGELVTGTEETWERFAEARGLSCPAVWTAVHTGVLRFTKAEGQRCSVVTDDARRAAEFRRLDGETFRNGKKAYPLPGVDKTWLPGADLIAGDADILITEGATDFLTAFDKYVVYRKAGGPRRWCPMALLGSKCKRIDPELLERVRGRHVRLVPDADKDGDIMRENMSEVFTKAGCPVDVVTLPRGRDLTDMKDEIEPGDLLA